MTHLRRVTMEQIQQTSGPIDRVAARGMYPGETFAPAFAGPVLQKNWGAPPVPKKERPLSAPDYSGFRRGYMTAMYYYSRHPKRGSAWVCRCDCGRYEFRYASSWAKKTDVPDACVLCAKTYFITHGMTLQDTQTELEQVAGRKAAGVGCPVR